MMNKKVLTIAGSDSSGGAGIQADLKTMCAYDVYGMSVITAVTAQNTLGVQRVEELPPETVAAQLSSVLEDIYPDAVKIGMVYSRENVEVIADAIDRWKLKNIVLDPVMVSTSGRELLRQDAVKAMEELLFPRAALVTPNVPEAERLAGILAQNRKQADTPGREEKGQDSGSLEQGGSGQKKRALFWMEASARNFASHWRTAFLIKGGHLEGEPADYLYDGKTGVWFSGERMETRHTHGTGCTLSAAIACNLAKGFSMEEAVREAKEYLTGCVRYHPGIGFGAGPLNHLWRLEKEASFGKSALGMSSETGRNETFR